MTFTKMLIIHLKISVLEKVSWTSEKKVHCAAAG
jgi:hypothetical protein